MDLIAPAVTVALLLAGIAVAAPIAGVGFGAAPSEREIALRASVLAEISPGTSAPVRLTASNAGSSAAAITTVHLVDIVADATHASCVTTDFTMTDTAQHASVPAGARDYPLADGTRLPQHERQPRRLQRRNADTHILKHMTRIGAQAWQDRVRC